MKLLKFSFLFIFGLFLASCSKDEKTNAELLQDGTWKLKDIKLAGQSVMEDCNKDDTMKFSATKISSNVGTVKCDTTDVNEELSYTLSADQKTITVDGETSTITTLTETNLTLSTPSIFGAISLELTK